MVFAGLGLRSSSSVTVTAGAGYTLVQQATTRFGSRAATESQISSAAGVASGAFSLSGSTYWSCVSATFR